MNCAKVMERNVFLEGQNIALRSIVSALLGEANHNPFCTIGHWVEHGPCAAMLVEFDRASKEAYAKVLTEVAAMVPNAEITGGEAVRVERRVRDFTETK